MAAALDPSLRSGLMTAVPDVLRRLKRNARAADLGGMAKFGITIDGRLGVSVPDMRKIAKEIGQDHGLALDLWKTAIAEARQVAAMIDDPRKVTEKQMEIWVADFNSWDLCDGVCLNLFEKKDADRLSAGAARRRCRPTIQPE